MAYTIYLRRNKVNGKCYVGQTGDFKRREYNWRCLKYYYTNDHICNDRAKYGLDNFTVEVLATTDNREEALEFEQRFIRDYNTLWPNGYNLDSGGVKGKKISDVSKQKMSESKKGKPSPMKGKHLSNEAKLKISEALKGKPSPMYGKHQSNGTRQKISEANKGKHRSDEIKQKISKAKKGKRLSDETRQKMSEAKKGVIPKSNPPKTVYQYTLDGELVKVWPSVAECRRNGFNQGNISMCCNGKKKTYKGFKWSYTPL